MVDGPFFGRPGCVITEDLNKASPFTDAAIKAAAIETERLTRELDITNADHIALWLEANMGDSSLAWLACRIVEAHESVQCKATAALRARAHAAIAKENEGG